MAEEIVCPVCKAPMEKEEKKQLCPKCETPHHQKCWEYSGKCSVYGCVTEQKAPSVEAVPKASAQQVQSVAVPFLALLALILTPVVFMACLLFQEREVASGTVVVIGRGNDRHILRAWEKYREVAEPVSVFFKNVIVGFDKGMGSQYPLQLVLPDGSQAEVCLKVAYTIPEDATQLLRMHRDYASNSGIEAKLVVPLTKVLMERMSKKFSSTELVRRDSAVLLAISNMIKDLSTSYLMDGISINSIEITDITSRHTSDDYTRASR